MSATRAAGPVVRDAVVLAACAILAVAAVAEDAREAWDLVVPADNIQT